MEDASVIWNQTVFNADCADPHHASKAAAMARADVSHTRYVFIFAMRHGK